MKKQFITLAAIGIGITIAFFACKKTEDVSPSANNNGTTTSTSTSSATIGGTNFVASSSTATSSANGLVLKFTDNSNTVQINTQSTVAGTYAICSACRMESLSATATVTVGTTTYIATTGTIILSFTSDGKITGTYTFDATSTGSQTISVKNGSFSGVSLSSNTNTTTTGTVTTTTGTTTGIVTTSGVCQVQNLSYTNGSLPIVSSLIYDSNGLITSLVITSTGGTFIQHNFTYDSNNGLTTWISNDKGKLNSYTFSNNSSGKPISYNSPSGSGTVDYDLNGRIIRAGDLTISGYNSFNRPTTMTTNFVINTFEYDNNGNCTKVTLWQRNLDLGNVFVQSDKTEYTYGNLKNPLNTDALKKIYFTINDGIGVNAKFDTNSFLTITNGVNPNLITSITKYSNDYYYKSVTTLAQSWIKGTSSTYSSFTSTGTYGTGYQVGSESYSYSLSNCK
jgi:hypothetical protein